MATDDIFSDVKKGEHASDLTKFFNTEDKKEIAKRIIKEGEVQLTAEYKKKLRDDKRKQIVNNIHRNAINPDTNLPHPPQRIENAMEEAKVRIDEYVDVNRQIEDVLKKIRPILPIKFEVKEIAAKIPAEYAAKSYPIANSFGKKLKEEWMSDGSLVVVLEIPGGLEEELHNKLSALCHGDVETKILKIK